MTDTLAPAPLAPPAAPGSAPGTVRITVEGVGEFDVGEGYLKLPPDQQEAYKAKVRATVGQVQPEQSLTPGDVAEDALVQGGIGLAEGAADIAGAPGSVRSMATSGLSKLGGLAGVDVEKETLDKYARHLPLVGGPSSEELLDMTQEITGEFPKPKTPLGVGGRDLMRLAPAAAFGPGSLARKGIGYIGIPAAGGWVGGKAGEWLGGEGEHPYAKAIGQLLGFGPSMLRAPRVLRNSENLLADSMTPEVPDKLNRLGREAILPDTNPALLGLGQGVASRPGEAMNKLRNVIDGRDKVANARIRSDLNSTLGRAAVPAFEAEALAAKQSEIGSKYPAVKGTKGVDPTPVIRDIDSALVGAKGKIKETLEDVRDMLAPPYQVGGKKGHMSRRPDTSAQGLHGTRMEISRLMKQTSVQGTPLEAQLTKIRDRINEVFEDVPGFRELDAEYSAAMRESEALDTGFKKVLKGGADPLHPEVLDRMLAEASPAEQARIAQGVRADIDRVIGGKANDVAAVNSYIKGEGDWNRAKLISAFGQEKAVKLFDAIERELTFKNTHKKIVEDSQTGVRTAAQRMIENAIGDVEIPGLPTRIMQGPEWAIRKIADIFMKGKLGRRDVELAETLAKRNGPELQAIVQALLNKQQVRQATRIPALPMSMAPMGSLRPEASQ